MIPLHNYDFWWHLATGKYIVENKQLPEEDPFTYTSHEPVSKREKVILKGNWLSEVIFYKVYSLWKSKGIIVLRSILLILFLTFVLMNIKKQGLPDLATLILLTGVFSLTRTFPGERPQLFTFFIFSIVYYLLEDFRINGGRKVYLIPILVMILSNMHPGYIVCLLLISIYLAGEGVQHLLDNTKGTSTIKVLMAVWVLTVLSSVLNPNGPLMLTRLFSIHGEHTKGIVEFKSPFLLYLSKTTPINYSYILFLIFSLLSLRYLKRIGLTHIILLTVFTTMGLYSMRYVIFYTGISAPILAGIIINLKDERMLKKGVDFLRRQEALLFMTACIIGTFLVFSTIPSFARYKYRTDTAYFVPEGAADFLSKLKIKGNMFNEYGFGGYLIWRLYPDKRVFIDGRALEPDVYKEYQILAYAVENSERSWKDIIREYDISYIIMPPLLHHGSIYPLVERLFDSSDWVLIYRDHMSLIFLRNEDRNSSIIKEFSIDKVEGLQTIVIQASAMALKKRTNPYFPASLGRVFFKMGKFEDAERAFTIALQRDPDNLTIKQWLQKVREQRRIMGEQGM